jgi:hypothetical protein
MVCGLVASLAIWGIAREISSVGRRFMPALLLLASLGSAALFFGYVESYPPVLVAILLFLYTGLRACRTGSYPLLPALILAIAIACHLLCLFLLPAYAYLVFRNVRGPIKRAGALLAPCALALGLLLALGFGPAHWQEGIRVATRAFGQASGGNAAALDPRGARPYSILSPAHALDLTNLILLVLPAPLLLLLSRSVGFYRFIKRDSAAAESFLAWAAVAGFAAACALVLPVAPAQDWDLFSLFLLPLAVLAVRVGLEPLSRSGGGLIAASSVLIGIANLGAFVGVIKVS